MKKLLTLLLLSPLVYSDETTVKYCMDKYDPIELSKEFGQCVNDIKGASQLSEPKDLRNKEIKSDINTTEKAYIYKGLYESKPLPRAQIINDPFSKICSA